MTKDDRIYCAICAWRGTCAKKFSITAAELLHCIDFTRDLTIEAHKDDDPVKTEDVDKEQETKKDEG